MYELFLIRSQTLFNYTTVLPTLLPGDAFPVIIDNRTQFNERPSIKIRNGDFTGLPLISQFTLSTLYFCADCEPYASGTHEARWNGLRRNSARGHSSSWTRRRGVEPLSR